MYSVSFTLHTNNYLIFYEIARINERLGYTLLTSKQVSNQMVALILHNSFKSHALAGFINKLQPNECKCIERKLLKYHTANIYGKMCPTFKNLYCTISLISSVQL